jgi:hypothetical protein
MPMLFQLTFVLLAALTGVSLVLCLRDGAAPADGLPPARAPSAAQARRPSDDGTRDIGRPLSRRTIAAHPDRHPPILGPTSHGGEVAAGSSSARGAVVRQGGDVSKASAQLSAQLTNPGDDLWDTVVRLRDHVEALRQERIALRAEVQDLRVALAAVAVETDPSRRVRPSRSRDVPVETEVLMAAARAGRTVGGHTAPMSAGSLHG